MKNFHQSTRQAGVMLLEALLGILIFSIGALALVAMFAHSVSASADAQYRLEAANHAQRILDEIWTSVDRGTLTKFNADLLTYQHQPNTLGNCAFGGAASAETIVTEWVADVSGTAGADGIAKPEKALPGVIPSMLQIAITPAQANRISITICWFPPSQTVATGVDDGTVALTPNQYTLVSNIVANVN